MQFEWNSKDSVSFGLYKEVVESKNTQFFIWLESDSQEVNLTDFRTGGASYRFNNFVIKENIESNMITFCPNIAGCPAYFRIKTSMPFNMRIVRKDGTPGDELTFRPGEIKLELNPVGMRKYEVSIDDTAQQADDAPEFFGGSFPSSSEQPSFFDSSEQSSLSGSSEQSFFSPSPEPAHVVNDPVEETRIFTGDFNSESDFELDNEGDTPSEPTSFFEGIFPTSGTRQGSPRQAEPESPQKPPSDRTVPPSPDRTALPPSGSVSGFSVPYVETEGIRERRENVQNLRLDNDRTAQEVEKLEKQIAELESRSRKLTDSKNSLVSRLERLQREYDKDFSKYKADIDEIKGRYTVDQSILEFYKDKDFVPTEDLLRQTDDLVRRVEEQIRLFVTARQKTTDEIEKALKVGKKE